LHCRVPQCSAYLRDSTEALRCLVRSHLGAGCRRDGPPTSSARTFDGARVSYSFRRTSSAEPRIAPTTMAFSSIDRIVGRTTADVTCHTDGPTGSGADIAASAKDLTPFTRQRERRNRPVTSSTARGLIRSISTEVETGEATFSYAGHRSNRRI
jgi:hypothetical protein